MQQEPSSSIGGDASHTSTRVKARPLLVHMTCNYWGDEQLWESADEAC